LEQAVSIVEKADILVIIGTSLQVYPAAGLIEFANSEIPIYYIDPKPASMPNLWNPVEIIPMNATDGVAVLQQRLFNLI
jgi:NAD-dependent deacetylase